MKLCAPGKKHLEEHYADLSSRPVFAMVWEGNDVVRMGRVILGETDPKKSNPGTIRGDFCIEMGRNICHGSDAVESANKEIEHWFTPAELHQYGSCQETWVYEDA